MLTLIQPFQFMVYPHMLPSKSPTSQSPFLLTSSRGAEAGGAQSTPAHLAGLEGEEGDSPLSAMSPAMGTNAGLTNSAGTGQGPAAAPGGSTATAAAKVERYRPRIFGFPTHETAKLHRWQEKQRDAQIERLERAEAGASITVAPDAGVGAGTRTGLGGLD